MVLPSGDQRGALSGAGVAAILSRVFVASVTTTMSWRSSRISGVVPAPTTMRALSGAQFMLRTVNSVPLVICVACFESSAMVQTCCIRWLPSKMRSSSLRRRASSSSFGKASIDR